MIEFKVDPSILADEVNYGTKRITVEIDKDHWAPGFYAGIEGAKLFFFEWNWIVESVDLHNRKISLIKLDHAKVGA